MKWKLLIALRALEFTEKLPARVRQRLRQRILRIEEHPETSSEYCEYDETGRLVDGCVCDGYAIIYWQGFSDRHVKVLAIELADD